MKKRIFFFSILIILLNCSVFAEYIIKDAEFNIKGIGFLGTTKEYSILTNYPLDKKTLFSSAEELEEYIADYKSKLESSRAFESVEITYDTSLQGSLEPSEVILSIKIVDSRHLLAMPYGKYSSNSGLTFKLKAKDSNFLGSLNTLSTDINLNFSDGEVEPSFTFSYDQPFQLGLFDAEWINDYSISYTIGEESPEWDLKTGLSLSLPFEKFSLVFDFYQYFYKDLDYKEFDDDLYFSNEAGISVPIKLYRLKNFTNITYRPRIGFTFNWDFDGINPDNDSLSSPSISISHSLSNKSVVWKEWFRSGYDISISNSYTYNLQRKDFVPYLDFELELFYNYKAREQDYWERFGINMDLFAFHYFDMPDNTYFYGKRIGGRLRGILDNNFFGNIQPAYTTSSGIVLNLDLPHHIMTTDFEKKLFNFNLQASPFFDMALVYNREKDTLFSFKDGYYCAGLEILVNPLKWSSYTIRASLGVNLNEAVHEYNFLEGISKHKELYIGLGLHY